MTKWQDKVKKKFFIQEMDFSGQWQNRTSKNFIPSIEKSWKEMSSSKSRIFNNRLLNLRGKIFMSISSFDISANTAIVFHLKNSLSNACNNSW